MTADAPSTIDADQPVWLIGEVPEDFASVAPAEGGSTFAGELAASNRAATAYSHQLLQQSIGGFTLPLPGEMVDCGQSPTPQSVGPAAMERLLLHTPTQLSMGDAEPEEVCFSSAAALVSRLDAGAVVSAESFGEQVPFARRLREHLDRVTGRTCSLELLVLGQDASWSTTADGTGGVVLVDGAVVLDAPSASGRATGPLSLGAAVAWNDVGAVVLRGTERWNAVIIVRIALVAPGTAPAAAAAVRAPVASSTIVSLLAETRFRAAGERGRADLFVRAVAPGGLIVSEPDHLDQPTFAIAGGLYGATTDAVRAVAMVHAGPALSVAALDRLLGSPAATDAFCDVATAGGWLEYCQKGDLLT